MMKITRCSSIIILLLGALGILLFLEMVELPDDTFLLRELNNTGHTPLFGALSLLFLALSKLSLGSRRLNSHAHYLLALIATCLIAGATESVQYFTARDADIMDFMRDLAGAVSFLAICWSFDSNCGRVWRKCGNKTILLFRLFGVLLLLTAFVPLALWGCAYLHRRAAFPQICSFESYWERRFLEAQDAILQFVAPPPGWKAADGDRVAKLTLTPAEYPGVAVVEPYPDWRGYESLGFEVYSELQDTVSLVIRINDIHHTESYYDRYNKAIKVAPGVNQFRLSLEDIRTAPREREMDMRNVSTIVLFALSPTEAFSVYVDDIHLR
ncbi:MAG: VanZ family protein [Candidatus Eisenbacteria sp.]|nr:VanZ family protein [Candidatus Eisenbacteria bacterium]